MIGKLQVVLLGGATLLAWAPASAAPKEKETLALIQKLSQEFSDASAAGDAATLDRLLDDHVTFMVENGELITKKDIVEGARPAPPTRKQTLVQSDFGVELYGDVAVTRFTDNSTVKTYGLELHDRYRSTEVWKKEAAGWKLISSQTVTVVDDPPAMALPAATLDEYVGRYQAGDGLTLVIARDGDGLKGTSSGNTYPLKAELRDVLFTPGMTGIRRLILRDAKGAVTGLISRRNGRDLVFKKAA